MELEWTSETLKHAQPVNLCLYSFLTTEITILQIVQRQVRSKGKAKDKGFYLYYDHCPLYNTYIWKSGLR